MPPGVGYLGATTEFCGGQEWTGVSLHLSTCRWRGAPIVPNAQQEQGLLSSSATEVHHQRQKRSSVGFWGRCRLPELAGWQM